MPLFRHEITTGFRAAADGRHVDFLPSLRHASLRYAFRYCAIRYVLRHCSPDQ